MFGWCLTYVWLYSSLKEYVFGHYLDAKEVDFKINFSHHIRKVYM